VHSLQRVQPIGIRRVNTQRKMSAIGQNRQPSQPFRKTRELASTTGRRGMFIRQSRAMRIRRPRLGCPVGAIVIALLLGCAAPALPAASRDPAEHRVPRAAATPSDSPLSAASSSGPSEPETPPKNADGLVCLMWNVCNCNLGCAGVRPPGSGLKSGLSMVVASGTRKGDRATIVEMTDAAGRVVYALSDVPAGSAPTVRTCERPRESKSFFGYVCAEERAGTVPANACASGCGNSE
jgi:hypothetical protein